MKIIFWITLLLALWLNASFYPCSAETLIPVDPINIPISVSQYNDPILSTAPMRPPGPSEFGEPPDTVANPLEPSTSLYSTDPPIFMAQYGGVAQKEVSTTPSEPAKTGEPAETIADPLEPINRAFFQFNDRLYFWVLKPVASGYKAVVPEDLRIGVRNFFSNVATPIRLVNCLFQAKFKAAGNELIRFLLNTTLGLAGFLDPAKKELSIERQEEDFGQTLGLLGIGPAFYIEWPILGAFSFRDTFGFAGDLLLDPQTYLIPSIPLNLAIRSYDQVNDTSLKIGEYEDFKKAALDPYIAKRDAYHQNRQHKIKEK